MEAMSSLTRVGWYWNQLRGLSVADIVERAGSSASRAMTRRPVVDTVPLPRPVLPEPTWLPQQVPSRRGLVLRRADELLGGRWRVLSRPLELAFPPDWNCNPANGGRVPLTAGRRFSVRDIETIGDYTYLLEMHRHRELVVLAQAWQISGERRYLDAVGDLLGSWFAQCPFPHGAAWSCPGEAGIRLINWALTWQLVGGIRSPLFDNPVGKVLRTDWLNSVWRHAEFIDAHPGRRALGDHKRIAELAGLYVAGVTWPHWDEAASWRSTARDGLEKEVLQQIGADGVCREQSIGVQQAVWDCLMYAAVASRSADTPLSGNYWQRLEAMLEFLAAIMDASGNVPQLGDSDRGQVSGLALGSGSCAFHAQLAIGALLFRNASLARKAGVVDPVTEWLLGDAACTEFDSLMLQGALATPRTDFPEGGVYVLGANLDTPGEFRAVVDAGALGLAGVAAHGHADALSFTLSMAGREFLVDPGSGTYLGAESWRNGFRGTAMHNTLSLDGDDQAVSGGRFIWTRRYQTQVIERHRSAREERLVAEHDGYRRKPGRPVHRRAWQFDRPSGTLSVTDSVSGSGVHDIRLHWQFSEECSVTCTPEGLHVSNGPVCLEMLLPPGGEVSVLHGSETPLTGWVSRGYDQRVPSTTVIWRARVAAGTPLETVFRRLC
ncbi:alginate lyase family protein [Zoogloea sp.]|uniref:heparinase II/III family protein n=1 Tax=Zoogloea sp. TaxID=49181 RepID=UPI0031FDB7E0